MTQTLYLLHNTRTVTPWLAFTTLKDAKLWQQAHREQEQVIREITFVPDFCREHAGFNPCWKGEHKK